MYLSYGEHFGVHYQGMAVPFEHEDVLQGCVMAIYPAFTEGKSVVTVKSPDGWKPIPFTEVKYLEVKDRKTHVHAEGYSGTNKNSLQEFEFLLPRESFIRCHRSFIVNVHHIEELYPDTHSTFVLAMDNGGRDPVSRADPRRVRERLGL